MHVSLRRPRREFAVLEARLDPSVIEQAWHNFINGIVSGVIPDGPGPDVQGQLKLVARVKRLHERRDRHNAKRNKRKMDQIASQMRPEFAVYIAAGLVPGLGKDPKFTARMLGGAAGTDLRLTKRFMEVMETTREMVDPKIPPHLVDIRRARLEAATDLPSHGPRRAAFESTLLPLEFPEGGEGTVVPIPVPVHNPGAGGGHDEEDLAPAAGAAS